MCQDTGTAIVMGKKGRLVWTDGDDEDALADGIRDAYFERNLRYSQLAPLSMFEEANTRTNLPAQIDLYAEGEDAYKFLFVAKGGGSANKTFLYQDTPSLLTKDRLMAFLKEKILTLGTSACPPYHLAIVIGGTSAELDDEDGEARLDPLSRRACRPRARAAGHAFRDLEMEAEVHKLTQRARRRRAVRRQVFLPRRARHPAAAPRRVLPIGLGVSCSADRQALGKITRDGVFLEQLETNPAHYLPEVDDDASRRRRGRDRPDAADARDPRRALAAIPIRTRLVADRPDDRGARSRARQDQRAAGARASRCRTISATIPSTTPARPRRRRATPRARSGPPRRGAWTAIVDQFQAAGGSMVMLAKGNRSKEVREACAKHGGFYLGSIGGPAARLAQDCIKKVEVLEYPELGMEADLEDRGRELPRLHRHRRQGERLLQGTQPGLIAGAVRGIGQGRI